MPPAAQQEDTSAGAFRGPEICRNHTHPQRGCKAELLQRAWAWPTHVGRDRGLGITGDRDGVSRHVPRLLPLHVSDRSQAGHPAASCLGLGLLPEPLSGAVPCRAALNVPAPTRE